MKKLIPGFGGGVGIEIAARVAAIADSNALFCPGLSASNNKE